MHTLSVRAFKVLHIVRSKNLMISKVVLSLALEEETSPNCELLLKSYQRTDILMILPYMVQQRDCPFTLDSCLDSKVSDV